MTTEAARKAAVRSSLRAARRVRATGAPRPSGRDWATQVLGMPEVQAAQTLALYVAGPFEPPTADLLQALLAVGRQVLLPVVLPDLDLDWAWYEGPTALSPAQDTRMALLEPTGPRLGRDAIAGVDVVLAPGLAVGADGCRLGQGGGSYDRALARVPAHVPVVVLLFDDEVMAAVPAEPHDRCVDAAVTPHRVIRFSKT